MCISETIFDNGISTLDIDNVYPDVLSAGEALRSPIGGCHLDRGEPFGMGTGGLESTLTPGYVSTSSTLPRPGFNTLYECPPVHVACDPSCSSMYNGKYDVLQTGTTRE
jgi:hypothetical protein